MGILSRLLGKKEAAPPPALRPLPPVASAPEKTPPQAPQPQQLAPKPAPEDAILGEDTETRAPLFIPMKTRERHLYLIGKSGTGKTTLIKNLITGDMQQGAGVAFIDPHGDAAAELLDCIPQERIRDVIYFDPASEQAPAFNPFALPYPPEKLTEDIVSSFKMFFGESWGVRLEHLLRYGILTLLTDRNPHTLKDLQTFFLKPEYKEQILASHPEESMRDFWQYDPNANEKGAVSPILNKLSQLLMPRSPMARIFSQQENNLDFSSILNEQKILIVNLSKGMLGDAPAFLLGGLIVTGIQQAALARAALPEKERRNFYFYVDEFQNYTIASFNSILAEARKYRLFLTLANQTLGQLPRDLESNIFGNVATLVSFQVSADDAATLKKEIQSTRLTIVHKGTHETLSLDWLIEEVKRPIQEELERCTPENFHAFYSQYREQSKRNYKERLISKRQLEEELKASFQEEETRYHEKLAELLAKLARFENRETALLHVRENHKGLEIRQAPYPEASDFTSLPARHAFARIEQANNVHFFKTMPPPSGNPAHRAEVLRLQSERARKRQEAKPPPSTDSTTPSAPPPAPQKPPKEEEDFRF